MGAAPISAQADKSAATPNAASFVSGCPIDVALQSITSIRQYEGYDCPEGSCEEPGLLQARSGPFDDFARGQDRRQEYWRGVCEAHSEVRDVMREDGGNAGL